LGIAKIVFEEHMLYKNFEPGPEQYQAYKLGVVQ